MKELVTLIYAYYLFTIFVGIMSIVSVSVIAYLSKKKIDEVGDDFDWRIFESR